MSPFANAVVRNWRNHTVGALVALALMPVGDASAQKVVNLDAKLLKNAPLGSAVTVGPSSFVGSVAYSNYVSTGATYSPGGAALNGSNTITRLLADDVTPLGSLAGGDVREMKFTVANLNAAPVYARAHARFWFNNAGPGVPGNYCDVPADVIIDLDLYLPVGVNFLSVAIPASTFTLPTGTFWCGWSYDDKDAAFATSAAQLNNLGQALAGIASVGSSGVKAFLTDAEGSFDGVDNPAGSLKDQGVTPFNLCLEFTVDQATPSKKSTWSRVKQLYR